MSGRQGDSLATGRTPAEAEEFMALLLAAQSSDHECAWVAYFKKMGDRMVKEHVKEA